MTGLLAMAIGAVLVVGGYTMIELLRLVMTVWPAGGFVFVFWALFSGVAYAILTDR